MESTSPRGDYFDYIDIDAIDNQRNVINRLKHVPVKDAPSRASRKTQRGDVLFSMVRPYLRNIAQVEHDNCIASTGFYVCHSSGLVTSDYCFILMLSNYVVEGLNQYMKGDNSPSINNHHITSWLYPIPPILEQERISTAVEGLLNYVDVLFDAQKRVFESIGAVKTKILDLAIHGKLVPQDPNDEPAMELLKRINPAFKPSDNLHYERDIPKGWLRCNVSDAFDVNPKVVGNDEDECAFVPMALVPDGYSNELRFEKKQWATIKKGFTRFADGDIGVAKISPCLENRKSVIFRGLPSGIGAGTTELIIFRPIFVTAEYGLLFFKSQEFVSSCQGTYNGVVGQQRVNLSEVKHMHINIPPISEQHKIVQAVEQLFIQLESIQRSNNI